MQFFSKIVGAVAVANLAGLTIAYKGMLKSCSHFSITNMNGDVGRDMILKADCSGMTRELDLAKCFG